MPISVTQVPKTTFYVNADNTTVNEIGSPTAPFRTVGAAVAAALAAGPGADVIIHIEAGDYSAQDLTLTQNVGWLIEGPVSGACLIGNITWQSTGSGSPVPQSVILLRNCIPKNITCQDGPGGPSLNSPCILENCTVLGNIITTGTGVIPLLMSGISTSASSISGQTVSSLVFGNINMPHSNVGLTNTQVLGTLTATNLWANGCELAGAVTVTTAMELFTCRALSTVTTGSLTIDGSTYARGLLYDSNPLTILDPAPVWRHVTYPFSAFATGVNTKTILTLPAKSMAQNIIAKTSTPWAGVTMKFSVGITGNLNKYISNYNGAMPTSDTNFAESAITAFAPISWVNTTPILLTATQGAGTPTAGSVDIWFQVSSLF